MDSRTEVFEISPWVPKFLWGFSRTILYKNISDINSLTIFMIFGLNQPKQGLHFEWNRCFKKNIFLLFLPYGTYKNGPNFFLCIFNEMIRNFCTCLRTIASDSICSYSLLSWFVSLFNKRSAVLNRHICKNYSQKILEKEFGVVCLMKQIFSPLVLTMLHRKA